MFIDKREGLYLSEHRGGGGGNQTTRVRSEQFAVHGEERIQRLQERTKEDRWRTGAFQSLGGHIENY